MQTRLSQTEHEVYPWMIPCALCTRYKLLPLLCAVFFFFVTWDIRLPRSHIEGVTEWSVRDRLKIGSSPCP